MSKNVRAMLAEKLTANTRRHAAAHQEAVIEYGRTHTMISVEAIDPNPYQPRKIFPQGRSRHWLSPLLRQGYYSRS